MSILVNGRFLIQNMSGVQRFSTELLAKVADIISDGDLGDLDILVPPHAVKNNQLDHLEYQQVPYKNRFAFEQWFLGRHKPNDLLVSLCNFGPVLRRNQMIAIHDAQVFSQPESYSFVFRTLYQKLMPVIARRSKYAVTVSEFSRKELEKYGVFPKGKAHIIHNGGDHITRFQSSPDTLTKYGIKSRGYFLALGSLAPHKNIPMLTKVMAECENKNIQLVVAGGGNAAVFQDAGVESTDNVKILGRVSDEDIKTLYENAIALVFPSFTEGFGIPPLEAMFCGCPVIASTGGAIPEVCDGAAIMLDPARPADWLQAINAVQDDVEKQQELIALGYERSKQFTWEQSARKFLKIIEQNWAPTVRPED
jgi:glycosyltransferase involved in cell wall biosynthesis